jgi:taurine dioxygenase
MVQFKTIAPFGVEIDLDLSAPLSPEEQQSLHDLYFTHGLIVARGQRLTMERQAELMAMFGPVLYTRDGVGILSTEPTSRAPTLELKFHADYEFSDFGLFGISLHALDVVNGSSSTRYVHSVNTCAALPESLRARLEGVEIYKFGGFDDQLRAKFPGCTPFRGRHPLLSTHPTTGKKYIRASQLQTSSVVGMSDDEGQALLDEVFGHLYAPANVYEHFWNVGDTVMWDNRAIQHARSNLEQVGNRVLQRVCTGLKGLAEIDPLVDRYFAPAASAGAPA